MNYNLYVGCFTTISSKNRYKNKVTGVVVTTRRLGKCNFGHSLVESLAIKGNHALLLI